MTTLEDKVERLKDKVSDAFEKFDVVDDRLDDLETNGDRLEELDTKGDELKADLNAALNTMTDNMDKRGDALVAALATLKEEFQAVLAAQKEEFQAKIEKLATELEVCKVAFTHGKAKPAPKEPGQREVRKHKEFKGERNAREVENFIWGMEKYFRSMGIDDDSEKVNIATDYLTDSAVTWWRRRCDDVKRGSDKIET